jgi:hypothetical protein
VLAGGVTFMEAEKQAALKSFNEMTTGEKFVK